MVRPTDQGIGVPLKRQFVTYGSHEEGRLYHGRSLQDAQSQPADRVSKGKAWA